MYKKKLWKIEELWGKYFYDAPISHSVIPTSSSVIPSNAGIQNLSKNINLSEYKISVKANTCPANDINLADINIENNSPFDFSFKEENKLFWIQNLKKFYKNNVSIYNPDFQIVSKFNFEASKKPVHSDDYGKYFGLKNSQVLEKDEKIIYLFDNHNKIIQAFLEYMKTGGSKASSCDFDVVHVDAHDDDAVFAAQKPQNLKLEKVQEYIAQTRISDFFNFLNNVSCHHHSELDSESHQFNKQEILSQARNDKKSVRFPELISGFKTGSNDKLIKNIYRYTKSSDFQKFKKPKNHYILSLDIDIFGPEGGFVDLASKVKIIAEAWQHADVVCIATSPGFIDQKYAQGIIEIFVK